MSTQPEALRLADELNEAAGDYDAWHKRLGYDAAAELRRLHEVNTELLEALKKAKWMLERDYIDDRKMAVIVEVDAVITKVEAQP